jgi:hypothetical protein
MDGKGSWRDDVFVERIWTSVKYEEVHLRAYVSVSDARLDRSIPRLLQRLEASPESGTANARSGLLQRAAANPDCGMTAAKIHLATAQRLFRQTEPAFSVSA